MSASDRRLGEATLRWMHESATGGIVTTDTSLRIVSWNRWLAGATGISEESAVPPVSGDADRLSQVIWNAYRKAGGAARPCRRYRASHRRRRVTTIQRRLG